MATMSVIWPSAGTMNTGAGGASLGQSLANAIDPSPLQQLKVEHAQAVMRELAARQQQIEAATGLTKSKTLTEDQTRAGREESATGAMGLVKDGNMQRVIGGAARAGNGTKDIIEGVLKGVGGNNIMNGPQTENDQRAATTLYTGHAPPTSATLGTFDQAGIRDEQAKAQAKNPVLPTDPTAPIDPNMPKANPPPPGVDPKKWAQLEAKRIEDETTNKAADVSAANSLMPQFAELMRLYKQTDEAGGIGPNVGSELGHNVLAKSAGVIDPIAGTSLGKTASTQDIYNKRLQDMINAYTRKSAHGQGQLSNLERKLFSDIFAKTDVQDYATGKAIWAGKISEALRSMGLQNIPGDAAIDLMIDPGSAQHFDEAFGAGSAAKILGGQ